MIREKLYVTYVSHPDIPRSYFDQRERERLELLADDIDWSTLERHTVTDGLVDFGSVEEPWAIDLFQSNMHAHYTTVMGVRKEQ